MQPSRMHSPCSSSKRGRWGSYKHLQSMLRVECQQRTNLFGSFLQVFSTCTCSCHHTQCQDDTSWAVETKTKECMHIGVLSGLSGFLWLLFFLVFCWFGYFGMAWVQPYHCCYHPSSSLLSYSFTIHCFSASSMIRQHHEAFINMNITTAMTVIVIGLVIVIKSTSTSTAVSTLTSPLSPSTCPKFEGSVVTSNRND